MRGRCGSGADARFCLLGGAVERATKTRNGEREPPSYNEAIMAPHYFFVFCFFCLGAAAAAASSPLDDALPFFA